MPSPSCATPASSEIQTPNSKLSFMSADPTPPDPAPILDLLEAFRRSKTMFAAVSLGVFDALAAGPTSLTHLAATLQVNVDALERLLGACVALQLLRRVGASYENTL